VNSADDRAADGGAADDWAALDLRPHAEGATIPLRVRPKANVARVQGVHDRALKLSVTEPPEKGKANEGVCRLLARILELPLAAIEVVQGGSSQDKVALVRGLSPEEIRERLGS